MADIDPALIMTDSDEDEAIEKPIPSINNPLQNEVTLWVFMNSISASGWKPKPIAHMKSVSQFWNVYQYLKRPSDLENGTQLNFFIKGIEPAWEDPSHKVGGRWQLRYPTHNPNTSNKLWEELTLAFIGDQFTYPNEVTGVQISIRKKRDIISIWNKNGGDEEIKNTIRNDCIRLMGLPEKSFFEYQQFTSEDGNKE